MATGSIGTIAMDPPGGASNVATIVTIPCTADGSGNLSGNLTPKKIAGSILRAVVTTRGSGPAPTGGFTLQLFDSRGIDLFASKAVTVPFAWNPMTTGSDGTNSGLVSTEINDVLEPRCSGAGAGAQFNIDLYMR